MTEAWAMAFALWGAIAAFVVFIVVDEWGGFPNWSSASLKENRNEPPQP